jgi:hypothetical protein
MRPFPLTIRASFAALLVFPCLADTLISHAFTGVEADPLNGVAPDANAIRPVVWNAGPIMRANGRVVDGANTDQGAVFDLGLSWEWQPQSTYKVTLSFTDLDNAILFTGFRDTNPSGNAQAQTQGTVFALRVREITGSDNIGIFRWPGGAFTNAPELSYNTGSSATFELVIETNELTDAMVKVGTAEYTTNLTVTHYRYLFFGYEDPEPASPASDAKFDLFLFEGPLPPPLPPLRITSYDPVNQQATLTWETGIDRMYMIQGSENLVDWFPIDGSDINPFVGNGSPEVFVDDRADNRYFYRLTRP